VDQLLRGWLGPEQGGRWTEPVAGVTLGRPGAEPAGLLLKGVNPTRSPLRLRLAVGRSGPVDARLDPGRFEERVALPEVEPGDPLTVLIERLPPLVPGRVDPQGREGVGVFLTRLCLVAG
jgi:hypothetical protein